MNLWLRLGEFIPEDLGEIVPVAIWTFNSKIVYKKMREQKYEWNNRRSAQSQMQLVGGSQLINICCYYAQLSY